MNKLQLSRILMILTIILVAGFQVYWLTRLYKDEKQGLRKEADVLFRETVYKLQLNKLKNDTLFNRMIPDNLFLMDAVNVIKRNAEKEEGKPGVVITMRSSQSVSRSTGDSDKVFISAGAEKKFPLPGELPAGKDLNRVIFRSSFGDSLSPKQIDSAYREELDKAKIRVRFVITSLALTRSNRNKIDSVDEKSLNTRYTVVGLYRPLAYRAELGSAFNYLLGKITYPLLVSLFLITLTTASFIFLYRNLLAQRRLTDIKNDFISNITHELKTPIATVNVAIEALKSFNAMENPARTKEYLDISSSELQRLSLLVDKVLKLSLFENKEIDLKKETFDFRLLTEEVIKTMQLQLQKRKAELQFTSEGADFHIEADKLHITSVVYNLLDNALKYSPDKPHIAIHIAEKRNTIEFTIRDNGIGIPQEYKDRIFDKFFRVPHGNMHNIKGYGLGLSYVHHVIEKHKGSLEVESEAGKGSTFIVTLLKQS